MGSQSKYGKLRFCPNCGVEALDRDHFPDGPPENCVSRRTPANGCEYVCRICGFGFNVRKSRRVNSAEANATAERKRPNVRFTEECVGKEIARKFLESLVSPDPHICSLCGYDDRPGACVGSDSMEEHMQIFHRQNNR